MPHYTLPRLLNRQVSIALIGCGGNGSQMLTGLARLNKAITALGHPGLHVQTFDPDTVSEANIGRQLFSESDVGMYKSIVLTNRINAFFGLKWDAYPTVLEDRYFSADDIAICCVDSRKSRLGIKQEFDARVHSHYFMDLGNRASDGQVMLGQWDMTDDARQKYPSDHISLANPYDLLPELVDITIPEDDTPSCGLAEALEKQDLFINQSIVTPALQILWQLLRYGQLSWHGAYVNLKTGNMRPVPVREIAC